MIYSIVGTAKENGINPNMYLTFLLEQLPNIDVKDQDALDKLLPWSKSLPASYWKERVDELAISNSDGYGLMFMLFWGWFSLVCSKVAKCCNPSRKANSYLKVVPKNN